MFSDDDDDDSDDDDDDDDIRYLQRAGGRWQLTGIGRTDTRGVHR
jgi:hypothetical protein